MRIGSYNLFEFGNDTAASNRRRGDVIEVIGGLGVDVLAVQEIGGQPADSADAKSRVLDELAADTGLCCRLGATAALAVSEFRYATAVLWSPRVDPVGVVWPGVHGFRRRVAGLVLTLAGRRVAVCSYHARPAGIYQRADDAACLAMCLTRGAFQDAVLLGDFNDTGCVRSADGGYLDPDWASSQQVRPDFVFEADWTLEAGQARLTADRRPAHTLELGGLCDVVGILGAPAEATAGHWPGDWSTGRRKDRIHVTAGLRQAVRAVRVVRDGVTLRASDHLPLVVDIDPDRSPVVGCRADASWQRNLTAATAGPTIHTGADPTGRQPSIHTPHP